MHLVRHGQSAFNLAQHNTGRDPGIVDAGLTPLGFEQASRAAQELKGRGVTRVISSPYRRALQTATVIAETLALKIEVEPLAGERALYSCDIGTPASRLRIDWPLHDFTALQSEQWWPAMNEPHGAFAQRVAAFQHKWRDVIEAGGAVLISHWYVLNALSGCDAENGEVIYPTR